ncbi:zinc ABC transporter substrate-binding protein [Acidaminococcus fermentans]|uniref:metal ABC transporter solute-binding protein, Zn/Mn family n=1 Tax=Acidaminococcus fermentans TaxID=905 RepID=UPI002E79C77D|nr:zinc ABC transporter substrate-binding protein [Acidaminococcus fermentans]MEE1599232.1 zinc ABC transporter substrate-binding protein [Acidaminococcus fermentans]MEE4123494.1 zinc ABC transporter substrate-binding protein [Acidaminococcus fermentans]
MKRILLLLLAGALVLLAGCGGKTAPEKTKEGKLPVVASFYAMKEMTEAIGGDKVAVTTLIPEGTEPHEFQPTTKSMKELSRARVLVVQGLGMEPWAEEMVKAAENRNLVQVVAAREVTPIANEEAEEVREHGQYDPHAWLSPACAQVEAAAIVRGLSQADPANAGYYQANGEKFISRLRQLEETYKGKFQSVPRKDFVTGHAAFAYLCRDFGLEQNSVEGVFASGEPNARQLANLVEYCRQHQVNTIFTEAAVSPKTSQALAREVGAKVVPIHTLEGGEGEGDYLVQMEENLARIYESLK